MRPIVLVVIDGLRRDTARRYLTIPFQVVEEGRGFFVPMLSFMPTKSRPSYNTISTGVRSPQNGTAGNDDLRSVTIPSIWSLAREHGLKTAASAYYWWSELFNDVPFSSEDHIFTEDGNGAIQHGFFYPRDCETDATVVAHALDLWQRHRPDLMLIHPCSTDFAGDHWGAASLAYSANARLINMLLEPLFETIWSEHPEAVILVTSDHGMSDEGGHGWDAPELREVFFFALGDGVRAATVDETTSLDIAPTILRLLGIGAPCEMQGRALVDLAGLSVS